MKDLFIKIGCSTERMISTFGSLTIMTFKSFIAIRKAPNYINQIIEQFIYIGRESLPIVLLTSTFIGLAMGVQIGIQMTGFTPHWMAGGLVLRTMLIDIGPVMLGLILAGRVSAGIAAELGTMKVTEQIDALRSFAIDPIEYLITPRLIAAMFAVPTLLVFANLVGVLAGYFSTYLSIDLSWAAFVKGMRYFFYIKDVETSIIKSFLFGIVIVIFGAFYGLNSLRGAKGVGKATTLAVVWASVVILILDYLVSAVLFFL